jgi:hypothetical protein
MSVEQSLLALENYIIAENFRGYDPYDTLTSWLPFKFLGKWPAAIATQIQKRNPVNIRPLLGINKGINPKAFGLFLQAYSILYRNTGREVYLEKASFFFNWLSNNYSKGYSGKCWGYNFPWSNPEKYMDAYIPSSVVTGFVSKGVFEYYQITRSSDAKELLESACLFLNNDLEKVVDVKGISISYTPIQKDICYNSSLLAAETFAKTYSINNDETLKNLAIRAVDFVIDKQHENGKWNYSINLEQTKEQEQIDFHQGYVLESIFEIKNILHICNDRWENAIEKGLKFYVEEQFDKSGRSFWRLPKKYPVEIHNQSQGIITLLKLKGYYSGSVTFAKKIAEWTIINMQGKDGHFFYQKFKTHTNKISYMRWSNAWMFLALTYLIINRND